MVRGSIERIHILQSSWKILRIFILSLFLYDVSIEHVHRQSQESAFTPQSSACVLLPGYSPLACRTALLIFLSHLFSSLSLLGHYLSRVLLIPILLLGLRVCACMCDYRHTFPNITLIEVNPRTIQYLANKNN